MFFSQVGLLIVKNIILVDPDNNTKVSWTLKFRNSLSSSAPVFSFRLNRSFPQVKDVSRFAIRKIPKVSDKVDSTMFYSDDNDL